MNKNFKIKKSYIFLAIVLFIFGIGIFIFFSIGNFLSPQDNLEKSDVIVVISGGDTTERTAEGVKVFKDGWAPYMLFSGAAKSGSVSNAKSMKSYALKKGVPSEKILIEEKATSTYENALFSKNIIEKNNFKKIILVTSPYHQCRASMNFKYVLGKNYKVLNHSSLDSNWSKSTWYKTGNINISFEELSRVIYLILTKNYEK